MYTFGRIFIVAEILAFVMCANKEIRIELMPCANSDKYPARFKGEIGNLGNHKYKINGTLVVDQDLGFNSTLNVREGNTYCSKSNLIFLLINQTV